MGPRLAAEFIRNLTNSVAEDLIKKIPNMPEDWDGHELRLRLADLFAHEVSAVMRNKRGKRYRDYQNEVATRNI